MAPRFSLHLLPAMVKAAGLAAFQRLAKGKGSHQAVVAVSFAAHSLPAIGCPFPVGLSGSQTCLVTADPGSAADLSALARPGLAVVAAVLFVSAALPSGPVSFVCPVCSSAAATGKGRVAPVVFYSLIPRSSLLRHRNCLLLLCFADQA